MEEQKKLKKQFFLHIVYNMIAFAIIFITFGIFLYAMIKSITFSAVDEELREAENEFDDIEINLEYFFKRFFLGNNEPFENFSIDGFSQYNMSKRINNPQIILIIRNESGDIINKNELGRISNYLSEITFDKENLENIYEMKLNNEYNYRVLNFVVKGYEQSNNRYLQLLINVDSEIVLINSYLEIIVYSVTLGILLSGIASFILSKKTLKPIEETLKNQMEFVQNASHELRTPLTIIQAKQELLLREPEAKIIDKSEDIILTLNETKRLSKLTKDLMLLVRGTNIKLQKEDIYIDELIRNIIVPYKDVAEARRKRYNIKFEF